jgi:catechol 2,3-dioxygenase-like lactoylglutathione lyase family enzyme
MRVRTARPTNALAPLRRFYVEGAGLTQRSTFSGHAGFDGLILEAGEWELEFVVEVGALAPRAPTHEHLVVLYLPTHEVERRAARLDALGAARVTPHNPYWAQHGVAFEDPDGYHFVLAFEE